MLDPSDVDGSDRLRGVIRVKTSDWFRKIMITKTRRVL